MEALVALQTARYDLVLMDVQMPGQDGLQTTRALRGLASGVLNQGVPVVAMTARAMVEDEMEYGWFFNPRKPVSSTRGSFDPK